MSSKLEFDKGFKMRMRQAREAAGYTQAEIAQQLGLEANTYSKYENRGKSLLPTHLIASFCEFTKTDPWYLLSDRKRRLRSAA